MAVSISINISQNSQSIANNTSNVTVKVNASWTYGSFNATGQCTGSITIDGTKYSFSGIVFNSGRTTSGSETIMEKTVNVSHNSNGSKTLSCSASFVTGLSSGTVTATASKTLTTIPRKSELLIGDVTNLETQLTLAVSRKSSSFTHTIVVTCGSQSTTICSKSKTESFAFTPPLDWSSENKTGTSVSAVYKITTYNGSTEIGNNSYTKTYSIPSSVKPSCSITVTDAMGYADKYGGYIKGLSKFKVVVKTTIAYGSQIASYSTSANGVTYTAASFTTDVIKSYGTLTVKATVKDNRGRSGSASVSKTVLDYSPPIISKLAVVRCNQNGTENDQGEYVKVTFSGSATSLNNKNTAAYVLKYKKTSETSYPSSQIITLSSYANNFSVTNATYIFPAVTGSSYDVLLEIKDNFVTTSMNTSASTAFTLMNWLASGIGMAIGKVAELSGWLDVNFKARFRDKVVIDSEWINMTLDSAFVLYNGIEENQPKYKERAGIVTVRGMVSPKTEFKSTTSQVIIASGIPEELRPDRNINFVCQGSLMNRWLLTITTSGAISVSRYGTTEGSTVSTNALLSFCATYQV